MKILGIGAHPDDLEFGCGGIFLKMAARGADVRFLVMTGGEVGGAFDTRRREQETAAGFVGAKHYWGGFKDTALPNIKELIDVIEQHINRIKPDVVFTHYYEDTHQDHRQVAQAVISASRHIKSLLFFEVPSSLDFRPTLFTDIGGVLQKKLQLIRKHKSQVYRTNVPQLSIVESVRSTAVYRGYQHRSKYAEGFMPLRLSLDNLFCLDR